MSKVFLTIPKNQEGFNLEKQLLTMAQIAKQLNLAESTARFYRDRFENFIPSIGEGRKKRYKPETIEVLRFIAEGYNRNLTAMDIKDGLSRMFARNIEFEKVAATTIATAQQQSEIELKQYALQLQIALEQMGTTMQIIANQKEEISELRKHIAVMENRQQEYINTKLDERDQKLIESIREIQETKKQLTATQQKKWWQFRK
jgi:DNA-binding transcriptional MerR regulator